MPETNSRQMGLPLLPLLRERRLRNLLILHCFGFRSGAAALPTESGLEDGFVVGDERTGRSAADDFTNDVQRQVLRFSETDARFAHVQLLARFRPGFVKPARCLVLAVD